MNARPRKPKNKALPPNLYEGKKAGYVFYRYKHPETGRFHGMGSNKADAIAAAKELNAMLIRPRDLVSQVMGAETVERHVFWFFEQLLPTRNYAKGTLQMYQVQARKLVAELGALTLEHVSVRDIAKILEGMAPRTGQQFRQVAIDIFKAAAGRGFIELNPAELALKPVATKSRKRLTLQQYNAILNAAPEWLRNAMRLALCTLQRRGDVSRMRFDQIRNGSMYVIQEKTKKHDTGYLRIEIGPTLAGIVADCRDDIASPYLIHRRPEKRIQRAGCDHWTQVTPEMISREFQSVRNSLPEFQGVPEEQRPTFHEIRALGIKQYKDKGEDPQTLAGHSTSKMTKNYDSGHADIRWMAVKSL